jgi:hypothetical protein
LELCKVRYFDHLVPRQARWVLGFNEKVRFKQEKTRISTTIVVFFWGVRDLLQPAKNGMDDFRMKNHGFLSMFAAGSLSMFVSCTA